MLCSQPAATRTCGRESGDFTTRRLEDWFPDEPVWVVTFNHENVVTVVTMHSEAIAVGLSGLARRNLDVAEQSITGFAVSMEPLGARTKRAKPATTPDTRPNEVRDCGGVDGIRTWSLRECQVGFPRSAIGPE